MVTSSSRRTAWFFGCSLIALSACADTHSVPPPATPPPPTWTPLPGPSTAQPQAFATGTPLPPGWAWPVTNVDLARGLAPHTVYRPYDAQSLVSMRGTSSCPPIEVAP